MLFYFVISVHSHAIDFYQGSYAEALRQAENDNKLLLLYFTAKWCGPCQYMEKYIFTDSEISYQVNSKYIALKLDIDIEAHKTIYYKYNAADNISVPRFFFVNAKEEVVKSHNGSFKLNQLKNFIDLPEWRQTIVKAATDSVAALRLADSRVKPTLFNRFMYNAMNSRWKPGISLGGNLHHFSSNLNTVSYGNRMGFSFKLFLDYSRKNYLFQPGISFISKGTRIITNRETVRLNYFEVPLRFSLNLSRLRIAGSKQALRLNLEPYAAYALSGKYISEVGNEAISFGSSPDSFKRLDYGMRLGLSQQMGSFELSIGYDMGFNNLSNQTGEQVFNRGFYFSMAVVFGK